jgi:hypothetical protein
VWDGKILGEDRHTLAILSRIYRPGFDHFSYLVRGFSQLLRVKTSAASQRGFQYALANLEDAPEDLGIHNPGRDRASHSVLT